jgi:hypothetical protein
MCSGLLVQELETSVMTGAELRKENQQMQTMTRAGIKPTPATTQHAQMVKSEYGLPAHAAAPAQPKEQHPWLFAAVQAKSATENMTMASRCWQLLDAALKVC